MPGAGNLLGNLLCAITGLLDPQAASASNLGSALNAILALVPGPARSRGSFPSGANGAVWSGKRLSRALPLRGSRRRRGGTPDGVAGGKISAADLS